MSDLTEFLLARIEEDEVFAEWCLSRGPWRAQLFDGVFRVIDEDGHVVCTVPDDDLANQHVAHHSPTRVMRECQFKRVAVQRFAELLRSFDSPKSGSWPDVNRRERHQARDNLFRMAAVYADHPDYPEEWRV